MVFAGCMMSSACTVVIACALGHFLAGCIDHVVIEFASGILFLAFAAFFFWQLSRTPPAAELESLEVAEQTVMSARSSLPSMSCSITPRLARRRSRQDSKSGIYAPTLEKTSEEPTVDSKEEHCAEEFPDDEELPWWRVLGVTFSLSFLGGLGDKTMFAMMMLASDHPVWLVGIGAMLGFTVIILIAIVFGQRLLQFFSQRMILLIGGLCFAVFGVLALIHAVAKLRGEKDHPEAEKALAAVIALVRSHGVASLRRSTDQLPRGNWSAVPPCSSSWRPGLRRLMRAFPLQPCPEQGTGGSMQ
jgi:putative Ca2+/H+ antiporter (TMEM165/GDT1 family)